MTQQDEFEKADLEAGKGERVESVEVLPPKIASLTGSAPSDVVKFRKQLVEEYHKGAPSLAARLKEANKEDMESLVVALLDELVGETDNLLGNGLVAAHNGELRDASVISFKRAEVIEKAIKAIQTKQQFEKQDGIDVESPSMIVIFRFFLAKSKEAFVKMGVGQEIADLFFRRFGEVTTTWQKELRANFEELRNQR